jgi:hypothetical protein
MGVPKFDTEGAMVVVLEDLTEAMQIYTVDEVIAAINATFDAADRATIAAGI